MTTGQRIGVFGGTFDPVHVGHLIVAEVMRHKLRLDEVILLPAGQPPHKPDQMLSDDVHRLAMLELALEDAPGMSVSRLEIDRQGPSYTADTVDWFARMLPAGSTLYFLIGLDSLRDLPKWRDPERIVKHAILAVASRPGVEVEVDAVLTAVPEAADRVVFVSTPLIDVSSSAIRDAVRAGGPFRFQTPPAVAEYIMTHGLYKTSASLVG